MGELKEKLSPLAEKVLFALYWKSHQTDESLAMVLGCTPDDILAARKELVLFGFIQREVEPGSEGFA